MPASCTIDGFGPLPWESPQSVAEVCQLVRRANVDGQAVYPLGGGTMLELGNPPRRPGLAVGLRSLNQIIDYPARDMTVTVQAGMTVAELQRTLAPENQQLPIDVPHADRATLGGILAANVSGARRYGYGTLRDYVLGISAVNDDALEIKAGGRVVKNVAGYDLCKLFVGSLGTLGIITQVTLKLRPLPEETALVSLACLPEQIDELLTQVHTGRTRPMCVELLNERATRWVHERAGVEAPAGRWSVIVGFDGNADTVKWQVQQIVKEARSRYIIEAYVNAASRGLWQALLAIREMDASFAFKANVLASATAEFCRHAESLCADIMLLAHAGNGIVVGQTPELSSEQAAVLMDGLRQNAQKQRGSVVITRCPTEWKKAVSVWGPPPQSAWLMRKVKAAFDPKGLFNPGRFIE
jgi:glycolate oxidase FAD binding subunit